MLDLDFLEIGTSDFDTLYQTCKPTDIGISVEPLQCYLDNLTGKPNVTKINCAIAADNIEKKVIIYYIPKSIIEKNKLPFWLLGCNSVGYYHPSHIDLNIEHLVKKDLVTQIPISKLLIDNNIQRINLLKLDTEGSDCFILTHLYNYLKTKDNIFYPQKIIFETNHLTCKDLIHETVERFLSVGYVVTSSNENTTLQFIKGNVG